MIERKCVVRRRLILFLCCVFINCIIILSFLSTKFMNVFMEYGKYECKNIMTRVVNVAIEDEFVDEIKGEIVDYNEDKVISINYNTAILNSFMSTMIKKTQFYFYQLGRGKLSDEMYRKIGILNEDKLRGIVYEMPISRVFNNILISNLGIKVPVKYEFIGESKGEIISSISEYGINNALVEISLKIQTKAKVVVPLLSDEEMFEISVPIVVQVIQGKVPESFYGSSVIGGNE